MGLKVRKTSVASTRSLTDYEKSILKMERDLDKRRTADDPIETPFQRALLSPEQANSPLGRAYLAEKAKDERRITIKAPTDDDRHQPSNIQGIDYRQGSDANTHVCVITHDFWPILCKCVCV